MSPRIKVPLISMTPGPNLPSNACTSMLCCLARWAQSVKTILERLPPLELPPQQPKSTGKAMPRQRPAHHPLVTAWRGFLEEAAQTEAGYMMPRKKNVLDAFVTKAMIRGAAEALDAILIELEIRGHRVQLSADYHHHRPPVDVAQREIRGLYERRSSD